MADIPIVVQNYWTTQSTKEPLGISSSLGCHFSYWRITSELRGNTTAIQLKYQGSNHQLGSPFFLNLGSPDSNWWWSGCQWSLKMLLIYHRGYSSGWFWYQSVWFSFQHCRQGIAKWALGLIPMSQKQNKPWKIWGGESEGEVKKCILGHTSFTDSLSQRHSSLALQTSEGFSSTFGVCHSCPQNIREV